MVVAISAISYGSYVLQKLTKGQGGMVLAALLGGAYSSTVTTVVLARQGRTENKPHLFSGGILMASGVMYLRLVVLLASSTAQLLALPAHPLPGAGLVAIAGGWLWTRRADKNAQATAARNSEPHNPLELSTAFLFALLFLAMLVVTQLAVPTWARPVWTRSPPSWASPMWTRSSWA